ncbi:MAG: hypothetical protein AUH84_07375 [Thaumarchaeota archaeon 13_1_40CM_4_38_7]|nr:MAG: hypothetical protein AUH84_07375 [Thaumarchaeota archaeon 13_1_40CM_4_38_7]OLC93260.1 MAG: hypothetical protein AUI92_03320 [Thaumarchaeota archaeon 13_1_40CM_3_38_6]
MPKKIPLLPLCLISVIFVIFFPSFAQTIPPQLSVVTDKTVYFPDDFIAISGKAYPVSGTPIILRILDPDEHIVGIAQINTLNDDGSYSKGFHITGPLWVKYGLYKIIAQRGSILQAQTSFYFEPRDIQSQSIQSVTVTTDKPSYTKGDSIVISGSVNPFDPYNFLTLQITNPDGKPVGYEQPHFLQDGSYHVTIGTGSPLWINDGTYSVKVLYGSPRDTQNQSSSYVQATTTFTFSTQSQSENNQSPQVQSKIPAWVRNIFVWYGQDKISDDDLLNAIKFLVESNIIQLKTS